MSIAKVGRRWWGKATGSADASKWNEKDATGGWDDSGAVRKVLSKVETELKAVISEQVRSGALDYASDGEFALRADEKGNIHIGFRVWDAAGAAICEVSIKDLINKSVDEASRHPTHQEAQQLLAGLKRLGILLSGATKEVA